MSDEEGREPGPEPLGHFVFKQAVLLGVAVAVMAIQTGAGRDRLRRAAEWGRYGVEWLAWKARQLRRTRGW